MENKQPVKKLIARIAAGVLSAAFLVGFAAPAAFALDTTGVGHFFEIRFSGNQTVGLKRL